MDKISFNCCPICGGELEFGKVQFPSPKSIGDMIEAEAEFYSDKTSEMYEKHPIKKFFQSGDKSFAIQTWGMDQNCAGYCRKCNRIFMEFEIND